MVGCGWGPTSLFFKSLDNNMVYSSDIDIFPKLIVEEQKSYGFENLVKLETVPMKAKIPIGRTIFYFSSKTSFFAVPGALLVPF